MKVLLFYKKNILLDRFFYYLFGPECTFILRKQYFTETKRRAWRGGRCAVQGPYSDIDVAASRPALRLLSFLLGSLLRAGEAQH